MNNYQHQQQANSNFRRGNTGIGMGLTKTTGGPAAGFRQDQSQNQHLVNQYAEDHDDDFEDEDFGDVDEHQENDANLFKNTEAREDFNHVENKMLQARNFNPPSQRQHQINRASNASAQYSFAGGQSFNNHNNSSHYGQQPESHFHQMSQNMINIQTSQNRIEAYRERDMGSNEGDSRDSNPHGMEYRRQSDHTDFFARQQQMIEENKRRLLQQNQPQTAEISHVPERQNSGHRPGAMRAGNPGPGGPMQNNFMNTVPSDLKQFNYNDQSNMEMPDLNNHQSSSHQRSNIPTDQSSSMYTDRFEASKDAVEGTKNFERAYDKLVKKFYNEEGANLLIPQEDMMIHEFKEENKATFNIEERQRKYAEQERRKQEKIRLALIEKERKEMEECSFAPKLHKKKPGNQAGKSANQQDAEQRRVKTHAPKHSYQVQDQTTNKSSSRANEPTHDDDLAQIRDVETFVADQERFLQQKRIKEQIAKEKQLHEEELDRVPKINKKSRVLLQQRQERLEQVKLQEKMERLVQEDNYQSLTSRLKKPTTSLTRLQRDKSQEKGLAYPHGQSVDQYGKGAKSKVAANQSPKFKPQISKNTDQLVENRKKRLQQNAQLKNNADNKQNGEQLNQTNAVKPSDKYLIQKFNKEFDQVKDHVISVHPTPQASQKSLSPLRGNQHQGNFEDQQYSPDKSMMKYRKPNRNDGTESPIHGVQLNYLRFKDMLISLGLLTEMSYAKQDSPERVILYDLWKILRGEETETVYVENLRVVVQVILRLIDPKRVIDVSKMSNINGGPRRDLERNGGEHQGATAEEMTNFGEIGFKNDRGQLCIRTTEVQKLQSLFNVYYLNRLQFYKRQLEFKKSIQQQEEKSKLSFKPQIATNSAYLANERKRKIAREMGLQEKDMDDEEIMDPANFLMHQGNLMKYKKEQMARQAKEEKFKKEHTFEPDTKLTKNKVIPKHPNQKLGGDGAMRTSVSSINLDGIARKKTTQAPAEPDPFDQEKKPRHAELYKMRKRQIDKTDKTKEDYEFERHGQECTFAPKLMSNPKYLRKGNQVAPKVGSSSAVSQNFSGSNSAVQLDNSAQNAEQKKPAAQMTTRQRQQLYEQKQLERMKKAREEKQRKNAMFERGEPKTNRQGQTASAIDNNRLLPSNRNETNREINEEQGVGDRVYNMQLATSPNMQQRQAMMSGNNRYADRNAFGFGNEEVKYRSRGQAENYEQKEDPTDLQYPSDPENNDIMDEDVGPMSLTINTKQFDEQFNEQPTHEQLNSEALQFQLDEQAADQTVKQEFLSRRTQKMSTNNDNATEKIISDHSPPSESPTMKQGHVSQSRKNLQQKMNNMSDNFGLDEENHHGNMFDNQPGLNDLDDSIEKQTEVAQQQKAATNNNNNDENGQESFQNNTKSEEALQQEEPIEEEEEPEEDGQEAQFNQQQPLLFVDINLGGDEQERIVVYEGDTAVQLAHNFCAEHNLDEETQEKLQELLEQQMAGVLPKVDEEEYNSEEEEEEDQEGQQQKDDTVDYDPEDDDGDNQQHNDGYGQY